MCPGCQSGVTTDAHRHSSNVRRPYDFTSSKSRKVKASQEQELKEPKELAMAGHEHVVWPHLRWLRRCRSRHLHARVLQSADDCALDYCSCKIFAKSVGQNAMDPKIGLNFQQSLGSSLDNFFGCFLSIVGEKLIFQCFLQPICFRSYREKPTVHLARNSSRCFHSLFF